MIGERNLPLLLVNPVDMGSDNCQFYIMKTTLLTLLKPDEVWLFFCSEIY